MLTNKKVTIYVTGGIAVYKAADLVRKFIKAGAEVRVAMTASAQEFVTPLTFQVLSKHDVYTDTFDEKDAQFVSHINLADWTELAVVAPATANILAKMANGIADDFVSTALLATTAPRLIVPAMNQHMLENPATVRNMESLRSYGYEIMEPDTGFLAEGYEGKGRMPEPEKIVEAAQLVVVNNAKELPLKGKKVLITAGGTKERIDPVRFITNDSSGKMGYSLAKAARDLGAEVTLVTATNLLPVPFGVEPIYVQSSEEMGSAVLDIFHKVDMVIMAAAVSDYRPKTQATVKIKKTNEDLTLVLEKTTDILAELGKRKTGQFLIGFAAETHEVERYALDKLKRKNADMIVANDVSKEYAGFNKDTNEVIIYQLDKEPIQISVRSKDLIAEEILYAAIESMQDEVGMD
ncbi:bifunctional phosphopantothenoylcysteine decarboxylase/phosphopantothenate--cysteine ligase CoaBC [Trichococcus ilyis]|uniref:Coenzyme A biosynthesis bifunctional protein CoaBC n=1 Tax=Trichococcus ilyis TaxID=640938 RepID=A0A143Y682_9LACT|nr:bifunctional phosphopantothenoylcysteine decarboxylase/phosphopantothenate--cysteine ligase CoaBC [Trichococcus ilyis]CZQ80718.1 flavoprotein [Trichococcus ilyis]SEI55245.1 phosphopantothenoylcysteine decarboxylase / phosphopantothenate--cysteine ligase [Trichococcus ilyis]